MIGMTEYERIVSRQVERVLEAPKDAAAAFFCACAERFLPLYDDFVKIERWGNPTLLRQSLDAAWSSILGGSATGLGASAEQVLEATPHADDFDSIETTFAQGAADLVAAAAAAAGGVIDADSLYAAFETLRTAATFAQTGYLDLGDSPEAEAFEATLGEHPLIKAELAHEEEDLATVSAGSIDRQQIEHLRARSEANRWTTARLLPAKTPP